jgi:rhodanese-related sulfurtransferase
VKLRLKFRIPVLNKEDAMPAPNEITPTQLMRLIGTPNAPRVLDVCLQEDFDQNPRIIPGAQRVSHQNLLEIAAELKGQNVVVSCWKGQKLSQGGAAVLRYEGVSAEFLRGGNTGWAEQGLPMIPVANIPPSPKKTTLWVTRHRPRIDRIACPWLIRRFVDRDARFEFVLPSEVHGVAARFEATPFDIEDAHWSHRGDTGELCTFDMMIEEFGLKHVALERLAAIVRGADTNRHDLHPAAAGLLAISVGLSRQYKDDLEQLEAGMVIYDALYRWARDGFDEEHDWPQDAKRGPAQ